MDSFFYSGKNGGVSGWSTFKSLRALAKIAKAKKSRLSKLLDEIKPDVAVLDSEYSIGPLRKRRIPIVALNTSETVVTQYLRQSKPPRGVRSHFWFVEFSDYLFHRNFCDMVLSPFPTRRPTRHRKFKRVGLIIRKAILNRLPPATPVAFASPRDLRYVVFMLSGSIYASKIDFEHRDLPFKVDVVGREGKSCRNVNFLGRQMDNTELLAKADALVINGGYSAVSEAFALRKPVFVVPVPGHAEQFVNASLVHEMGLGYLATEEDVLDQFLAAHTANEWKGLKPLPPAFEIDGAREAAAAILKKMGVAAPEKIGVSAQLSLPQGVLPSTT
jgi:UDP-N-acetylglucosamine:LPS N-acetylglucosamine transferase